MDPEAAIDTGSLGEDFEFDENIDDIVSSALNMLGDANQNDSIGDIVTSVLGDAGMTADGGEASEEYNVNAAVDNMEYSADDNELEAIIDSVENYGSEEHIQEALEDLEHDNGDDFAAADAANASAESFDLDAVVSDALQADESVAENADIDASMQSLDYSQEQEHTDRVYYGEGDVSKGDESNAAGSAIDIDTSINAPQFDFDSNQSVPTLLLQSDKVPFIDRMDLSFGETTTTETPLLDAVKKAIFTDSLPDLVDLYKNVDSLYCREEWSSVFDEEVSQRKLIVSSIYSKHLDILHFLLVQFQVKSFKRKGPQNYGDLMSVALEYDMKACLLMLKVKIESEVFPDDWNDLHKWVVSRWVSTRDRKSRALQVQADSDIRQEDLVALQKEKHEEPYVCTDGDSRENNEEILNSTVSSIHENEVPLPAPSILQNKRLLQQQDAMGWTPLHIAALLHDYVACKILVENGSPLDIPDYEMGRHPIHISASYGQAKILKYLISCGADRSALTRKGDSIMSSSIKYGNSEVVSFLITEAIGLEELDNCTGNATPMLLAIKHAHPLIVKQLLKAGADPNREINSDLMTYLHYLSSLQFCRESEIKIASLLLEYGGANVEAKDKNGATPLHYALLYNRIEMAELLLKHNAIFTKGIIDLVRKNSAIYNTYLTLREKKLTEHTAALVYPSTSMQSLNFALSGHSSVYTHIGEMLVFGGSHTVQGNTKPVTRHTNKLYKFSTSFAKSDAGMWTQIPVPSELKKRSFHTTLYLNGQLWCFGGKNDSETLDLLECLSISENQWINYTPPKNEQGQYQSPYPGPLSKHAAVISYRKEYSTEEIFESNDVDTIRKRVASYRSTPDPHMLHGLPDAPNVVPGSQSMVIYGGETANGQVTDMVWEYQFSTNEWTHRPAGPSPRKHHTCTYDHNRNSIIIFGGYNGKEYLDDCYDYSLWDYEATDILTDSMPPPRRCGHASVLTSNRMWIFGGYNEKGKLGDLWYLNLDSYTWCQVDISCKLKPRSHFSMNFINETQVAIVGGDKIFSRNNVLMHLPEHHNLHERITAPQPEEDGESQGSDNEASQEYIVEHDEEIVRDAPTTEYF